MQMDMREEQLFTIELNTMRHTDVADVAAGHVQLITNWPGLMFLSSLPTSFNDAAILVTLRGRLRD